jgi:hypothetical protein
MEDKKNGEVSSFERCLPNHSHIAQITVWRGVHFTFPRSMQGPAENKMVESCHVILFLMIEYTIRVRMEALYFHVFQFLAFYLLCFILVALGGLT